MSNDWTNKLREQLADYQEPVSHDLWAGIEQSLAQSTKVGDEETDVKKETTGSLCCLEKMVSSCSDCFIGSRRQLCLSA